MAFIDEAARELSVKLVWYSAAPPVAASLVRFVAGRVDPSLASLQRLDVGEGASVVYLPFVPESAGTLAGYTTRFHLFAVEPAPGAVDGEAIRQTLFKGVDGYVFIGGPDEPASLHRMDLTLRALGYGAIPSVFGVPDAAAEIALARGRALGFPDGDVLPIDVASGAGVLESFKALARKILLTVAGRTTTNRVPAAH